MPLFTKQYNLVPTKGRWCPMAGKVNVGLASHWPCITTQWFIHLRAQWPHKGKWAPRLRPEQHGTLYFFPTKLQEKTNQKRNTPRHDCDSQYKCYHSVLQSDVVSVRKWNHDDNTDERAYHWKKIVDVLRLSWTLNCHRTANMLRRPRPLSAEHQWLRTRFSSEPLGTENTVIGVPNGTFPQFTKQ